MKVGSLPLISKIVLDFPECQINIFFQTSQFQSKKWWKKYKKLLHMSYKCMKIVTFKPINMSSLHD